MKPSINGKNIVNRVSTSMFIIVRKWYFCPLSWSHQHENKGPCCKKRLGSTSISVSCIHTSRKAIGYEKWSGTCHLQSGVIRFRKNDAKRSGLAWYHMNRKAIRYEKQSETIWIRHRLNRAIVTLSNSKRANKAQNTVNTYLLQELSKFTSGGILGSVIRGCSGSLGTFSFRN